MTDEQMREDEDLSILRDAAQYWDARADSALDRLVARAETAERERDEWRETARLTETISDAGCDCGDDEACAWLRKAEAAEARVAALEASIASALTSLATGPAKDGYAYGVLDAALAQPAEEGTA